MLLSRLIQSLVESPNAAADDVLLEALQRGNEQEQLLVLDALIRRQTIRGLQGVVQQSPALSNACRKLIFSRMGLFRQPIRLVAREDDPSARLAAMALVCEGNASDLAYLLCEHLKDGDEQVGNAASHSLIHMAMQHRRRLFRLAAQAREAAADQAQIAADSRLEARRRTELEAAVLRAASNYRGSRLGELARAASLLLDSPGSALMPVFQTEHHMLAELAMRQLQRPVYRSQVPAMLVAATRGPLRPKFPAILAHLASRSILTALLTYSHRLEDRALQVAVRPCVRGIWLEPGTLSDDLMSRSPMEAAGIGAWILASGLAPDFQTQLLMLVYMRVQPDLNARGVFLRHILKADLPPEDAMPLLRHFAADPDDELAACSVRELARLNPEDLVSILVPILKRRSPSLRALVSRLIGERSFEQYWTRYDQMSPDARQGAGRAMLKVVSDVPRRLARLMFSGTAPQRLKAIDMVRDLGLIETMSGVLRRAGEDPDSRIRSRVVLLYRDATVADLDVIIARAMLDPDERVRANALEVIEQHGGEQYAILLAQRAGSRSQRERANAIKVLFRINAAMAGQHLRAMLTDERAEHRISGLWLLRELRQWSLIPSVAEISRRDPDPRVRRYASSLLRALSQKLHNDGAAASSA